MELLLSRTFPDVRVVRELLPEVGDFEPEGLVDDAALGGIGEEKRLCWDLVLVIALEGGEFVGHVGESVG